MALHTTLPIHVAAMKLLEAVTDTTLQLRRDAKKPLGDRLIGHALEITTLIQDANMEKDKTPHLAEIIRQKARVEALLLTMMNKKLISPGNYSEASRWAVSVGQQAVGWRKQSQQRQLHDRQGGHDRA